MGSIHNEPVSHNKFTMFRCLIAIAHVDGHFSSEERAYFSALVNHLPFTDEQRSSFQKDYDTPQDVFSLLREINEPKYRAHVLDFGRIMAFKDGVLNPTEDEILKKLHLKIVDESQLEQIKEEVRASTRAEMNLHDISIDMKRPKTPIFQIIDEVFLSLGVDLMRD